ncbi:MAG: O-antigen ligase family protein [Oscillospiraceae bacterium]|nr:O-antigen ligase family protein [Oscillospiraceae bacterium]
MTNNKLLQNGTNGERLQRSRKECPVFIVFLAVTCTVLAGLGDWKVLNDAFGALPKAIALGTIVCAFLNFLVAADFVNLKKAMGYFPILLVLIAVYSLVSMYIWITDFSKAASIGRAGQKILFQTITIIYAVFMCYLLEDRAINYLFFSMCATNTAIMLLEMPKYGFAASVSSVVTCIVTFGEAEGFVRALEIHDITFLFGQFCIYYLMFAPKTTTSEKRLRRWGVILSLFFMLVGLKRSTLPAVLLVCVYIKLLRMTRKPGKLILATGIGLFLFSYLYLYLTRSGILVAFLESLGIDMMGRDVLWSLPNKYYTLSPFWKGLGFEGVTDLVNTWYKEGLINRAYPLHNDFLKIFIELGAVGFTLWAGINYILYPAYWMMRYDTETGMLYMAILAYMTVTYLTDNTAFYFWSCIGLRLIPMSYSYRISKTGNPKQWKAPTPKESADEIWLIEMGGKVGNAE